VTVNACDQLTALQQLHICLTCDLKSSVLMRTSALLYVTHTSSPGSLLHSPDSTTQWQHSTVAAATMFSSSHATEMSIALKGGGRGQWRQTVSMLYRLLYNCKGS
jgi:hypothetical protein